MGNVHLSPEAAAYFAKEGCKYCCSPPSTRSVCSTGRTVAICRQINMGALHVNHDALEFPDGEIVLLTRLYEGQNATVLTLPSQPKTAAEAEAQPRVTYVD